MSKITKSVLRYNAVFEPCEEGGYTVTVPKMPGLVTEGESFEEALEMARDTIEGYLSVLAESKESLPEPDIATFTAPIDIHFPSSLNFA